MFVARNAQDEVADARFQTALKFLEDDRLPKDEIQFDDDGATDSSKILNFDFISSMGVVDHLAEVVDAVNEAVSLWSKLSLAEKRQALEQWATRLCDVCGVIDKSLSVHAYQCIASIDLPEDVFRQEDLQALRESVGSFQSDSEQVLKDWLQESPFREFLNTCLSFGKSLSGSPTVGKIIAERVTPIVHNSTLRGHVRSVIAAANKCAAQHIPDGVPDALEEFVTQDAAGKQEESYLACALALTVAMDKLKKALGPDGGFAAGPAQHAAEVTLAMVSNKSDGNVATDEADEEWAVPWVEVLSLPRELGLFAKYGAHIRQGISASVTQVFEKLSKHCSVDGLMLGSCVPATTVFEYLTSVVDPKVFGVDNLDIRRVFDDQLDMVVGRARSLLDLFQTLYDTFLGDSPFSAGASVLWHTSVGEVKAVEKAELFGMLRVLVPCTECAILFSLLHMAFVDAKQVVLNFELCPKIPSAIHDLQKRVYEAAQALTSFAKLAGKQCRWVASDKTLSEWVLRAGQVLSHVQKHCLQVAAHEVQQLADGLSKSAPKISHFVNDEHYLKPLAKKHLLDWKGKEVFSDSTVVLFQRMSGLAKLHGTFGLKEPLAELVPECESVAKTVFAECSHIIRVLACVNCVQTLTGEEQFQTAQELLAKKQTLPKALLSEVEAILAKSRGSKRKVSALNDETT